MSATLAPVGRTTQMVHLSPVAGGDGPVSVEFGRSQLDFLMGNQPGSMLSSEWGVRFGAQLKVDLTAFSNDEAGRGASYNMPWEAPYLSSTVGVHGLFNQIQVDTGSNLNIETAYDQGQRIGELLTAVMTDDRATGHYRAEDIANGNLANPNIKRQRLDYGRTHWRDTGFAQTDASANQDSMNLTRHRHVNDVLESNHFYLGLYGRWFYTRMMIGINMVEKDWPLDSAGGLKLSIRINDMNKCCYAPTMLPIPPGNPGEAAYDAAFTTRVRNAKTLVDTHSLWMETPQIQALYLYAGTPNTQNLPGEAGSSYALAKGSQDPSLWRYPLMRRSINDLLPNFNRLVLNAALNEVSHALVAPHARNPNRGFDDPFQVKPLNMNDIFIGINNQPVSSMNRIQKPIDWRLMSVLSWGPFSLSNTLVNRKTTAGSRGILYALLGTGPNLTAMNRPTFEVRCSLVEQDDPVDGFVSGLCSADLKFITRYNTNYSTAARALSQGVEDVDRIPTIQRLLYRTFLNLNAGQSASIPSKWFLGSVFFGVGATETSSSFVKTMIMSS